MIENGGDVDVIENGGNVDESSSWLYSQRCSDGLPGIRKFRDFTQFSPTVWTVCEALPTLVANLRPESIAITYLLRTFLCSNHNSHID